MHKCAAQAEQAMCMVRIVAHSKLGTHNANAWLLFSDFAILYYAIVLHIAPDTCTLSNSIQAESVHWQAYPLLPGRICLLV